VASAYVYTSCSGTSASSAATNAVRDRVTPGGNGPRGPKPGDEWTSRGARFGDRKGAQLHPPTSSVSHRVLGRTRASVRRTESIVCTRQSDSSDTTVSHVSDRAASFRQMVPIQDTDRPSSLGRPKINTHTTRGQSKDKAHTRRTSPCNARLVVDVPRLSRDDDIYKCTYALDAGTRGALDPRRRRRWAVNFIRAFRRARDGAWRHRGHGFRDVARPDRHGEGRGANEGRATGGRGRRGRFLRGDGRRGLEKFTRGCQ